MDKTSSQIETHIEYTRDQLGSNIQELEYKIKSATDWKRHFQNQPMTMMGVAFAGGVFLGAALGNGKHRRSHRSHSEHTGVPHAGTDHQRRQALAAFDNIKGALIGIAITRFKDFLSEAVPGFRQQFQRTEEQQKRETSSVSAREPVLP